MLIVVSSRFFLDPKNVSAHELLFGSVCAQKLSGHEQRHASIQSSIPG